MKSVWCSEEISRTLGVDRATVGNLGDSIRHYDVHPEELTQGDLDELVTLAEKLVRDLSRLKVWFGVKKIIDNYGSDE